MQNKKTRIHLLDELRGFTVLLMIIYHTAYTLGYVFGLDIGISMLNALDTAHYMGPFPFIFISGICTQLSRSNLRRGLFLLIPALGINLVTIIAENFISGIAIYFGVINMLSVLMILYGLLGRYAEKLPPLPSFIISLILCALTWGVKRRYIGIFGIKLISLPDILYSTRFLFPLGFPHEGFESSDYFPLLPWVFLFLAGAYFALIFKRSDKPKPKALYTQHSKLLCAMGRYSLYIYIAHQPVIYAVTFVVLKIINK